MGKIRVLTIDDSALMRQILAKLLARDPDIEVVGAAPDPIIARQKIKDLNPDVVTLDVEMPRMDGLTFLEQLMARHPMPVVMVSSLTEAGCETTLRALELGAVDFFTKPKLDVQAGVEEHAQELIAKIKAAAAARLTRPAFPRAKQSAPAASSAMLKTTNMVIAIGASTGGTEAVKEILSALPPDMPPVLVTQHMPERFTRSWASRLNALSQLSVTEARDGDSVLPGHALIAPGNYHMELVRNGARYSVRITQDQPVNRHRPSVDVMFDSVARYAGRNAIGVILTGMGADGANGLLAMKQAGAYTIAQDESTCVVFGMPKEAIRRGGVDCVLPLHEIAGHVLASLTQSNGAAGRHTSAGR